MQKTISSVMLVLLITCTLALTSKIQPVKADEPIYINADGSITPPTAPISTTDYVTYTFTDNIKVPIGVERDGIVLDGSGYTLQGLGTGISLIGRNHVTIKDTRVLGFSLAIYLEHSSNSVLLDNIATGDDVIYLNYSSNNEVSGNSAGIILYESCNNVVSGNSASGSIDGVCLSNSSSGNIVSSNNENGNDIGITIHDSSSNNLVWGNTVSNNVYGIHLGSSSSGNTVMDNIITENNELGIIVESSSGNSIFHNNFISNPDQVLSRDSVNTWDSGYPSGGNYWSDYVGVDQKNGESQDQWGSDNVGDTPYVIDSDNIDHYPLMTKSSIQLAPESVTSVSCSPNPVPICQPVTCTATVSGYNPTGTIIWSTSSSNASFSQFVCTLSSGSCSTTYTEGDPGTVTITACYIGDPSNAPSWGSTTLTVTSAGPIYYSQNYTSAQAAIDAAPPGATVIIAKGFYTESLIVDKPLTIIGEKDPPVFGGGASGIYLTLLPGASGSIITGLEITNFDEGILVHNASNCRIYSNIMASLGSSGIVLEGSGATSNVIFDNIFQDTPTPINLTASAGNNTIYSNIITSQAAVTINVMADGNTVYGNSISASQILLNITDSKNNLLYHNNFLSSLQTITPAAGNNAWDNGYPSGGNYWSDYSKKYPNAAEIDSSGIWNMPYQVDSSTDRYPLMKPWTMTAGHCVAVISVVAAKTAIGQGFNCSLTVYAADNGEYTESFNVTAYANAIGIGTRQVNSLNASCQMLLTFAWNTAGLAYGNYTIRACAQPVANQTEMSGNDFTLGTLKVTIPGDINGDFKVGLPDLVLLANSYASKLANSNWNPNADIDGNDVVGLSDLVLLAQHYGQHYP